MSTSMKSCDRSQYHPAHAVGSECSYCEPAAVAAPSAYDAWLAERKAREVPITGFSVGDRVQVNYLLKSNMQTGTIVNIDGAFAEVKNDDQSSRYGVMAAEMRELTLLKQTDASGFVEALKAEIAAVAPCREPSQWDAWCPKVAPGSSFMGIGPLDPDREKLQGVRFDASDIGRILTQPARDRIAVLEQRIAKARDLAAGLPLYAGYDADGREVVETPAGRYEAIMGWYAPIGEDGARHPGEGFVSQETAKLLLSMPEVPRDEPESPAEAYKREYDAAGKAPNLYAKPTKVGSPIASDENCDALETAYLQRADARAPGSNSVAIDFTALCLAMGDVFGGMRVAERAEVTSVYEPGPEDPRVAERLAHAEHVAEEALNAAEALWGVVANVGSGQWDRETPEWRQAAARARTLYHAALDAMKK